MTQLSFLAISTVWFRDNLIIEIEDFPQTHTVSDSRYRLRHIPPPTETAPLARQIGSETAKFSACGGLSPLLELAQPFFTPAASQKHSLYSGKRCPIARRRRENFDIRSGPDPRSQIWPVSENKGGSFNKGGGVIHSELPWSRGGTLSNSKQSRRYQILKKIRKCNFL